MGGSVDWCLVLFYLHSINIPIGVEMNHEALSEAAAENSPCSHVFREPFILCQGFYKPRDSTYFCLQVGLIPFMLGECVVVGGLWTDLLSPMVFWSWRRRV